MSDPGKFKITVGPGLTSQFEEVQKIVSGKTNAAITEEMKELMSKSVAELVAGDAPDEVQYVDVRGRQLVLPRSGSQRGITVLFACLYALENEAVDKILANLDLKAQFMVGGMIGTQPLVQKAKAPDSVQCNSVAEKQESDAHEEKPKRNIILGKPKLVEKPFAMVLVSDADGPVSIGHVETWRTKPGFHMVRLLPAASVIEVSEDFLTPLDTVAQIAEASSAVAARK